VVVWFRTLVLRRAVEQRALTRHSRVPVCRRRSRLQRRRFGGLAVDCQLADRLRTASLPADYGSAADRRFGGRCGLRFAGPATGRRLADQPRTAGLPDRLSTAGFANRLWTGGPTADRQFRGPTADRQFRGPTADRQFRGPTGSRRLPCGCRSANRQ